MVNHLRFIFHLGVARFLEGAVSIEYLIGHTSWIQREPIDVVGQVAPANTHYVIEM